MSLKKGTKVEWETPQGKTHGKVTKKSVKSSDGEQKYEVESDKSGKTAIHKESSLKKKR